MTSATLTKVGNSTAAFIPAKLREQAKISVGDEYSIESPRPGVIVMTFKNKKQNKSKLDRILEAEATIHELNRNAKPWIEGKTADDLIAKAKEDRARRKGLIY